MISGDVYETASGVVLKQVMASSQDLADAQVGVGEAFIAGNINSETHYYDPSNSYAVTAKPAMGLTYSEAVVDGAVTITTEEVFTISDIPAGVAVIHPGGSQVISDGELDFSSIEPGQYQLEFVKNPYRAVRIMVTVEAA